MEPCSLKGQSHLIPTSDYDFVRIFKMDSALAVLATWMSQSEKGTVLELGNFHKHKINVFLYVAISTIE